MVATEMEITFEEKPWYRHQATEEITSYAKSTKYAGETGSQDVPQVWQELQCQANQI